MNKKLIKTLASVACGLGVVSSIPFIASSCNKSGQDEDQLKPVPCSIEDFNFNNNAITYFSSTGMSKLAQWDQDECKELTLPVKDNTNEYTPKNISYQGVESATPFFVDSLIIPSQISTVRNYAYNEYCFVAPQLKKITFSCTGELSLKTGRAESYTSDFSFFSSYEPSSLEQIDFAGTNLKLFAEDGKSRDEIEFFKYAGSGLTGQMGILNFTNKSLTDTQKESLFQKFVAAGLDSNKWYWN